MIGVSLVLAGANGWGHMGGWGWGMVIMGWLFMMALVALVVWVIWSTSARTSRTKQEDRRQALDLAKERYARGEIDRDEYLQIKGDLE